jgi:aldose 1-epimerase
MEYILENEYLQITVTEWGAQLKSVICKADGSQRMWQADPVIWGYHAPILFPHAGKTCDNVIEAKCNTYPSKQHGFAREKNHAFLDRTEDTLRFVLTDDAETMTRWPYKFRLISSFRLEKDTVYHTLTVENQDTEPMPFGVGYHPAFAVPFDAGHTFADYVLRFSEMESPLCVSCLPHGLVTNQLYSLGSNLKEIPVDESLFANDSHCMLNLRSQTLGLYEKDTGRAVICDISQFPYTLLWSKAGKPHFVCIEPWMSLPSPEGGSRDWSEKPAAYILRPGQSQSVTLPMRFV